MYSSYPAVPAQHYNQHPIQTSPRPHQQHADQCVAGKGGPRRPQYHVSMGVMALHWALMARVLHPGSISTDNFIKQGTIVTVLKQANIQARHHSVSYTEAQRLLCLTVMI